MVEALVAFLVAAAAVVTALILRRIFDPSVKK